MSNIHDPRIPRSGPSYPLVAAKLSCSRRRRRRRLPVEKKIGGKAVTPTEADESFDFSCNNVETPIASSSINVKKRDGNSLVKGSRIAMQRKNWKESGASTKKLSTPPFRGESLPVFTKRQEIHTSEIVQASFGKQTHTLRPLSHVRHSFLVDTRTLDTKEGKVICQSYLQNIHSFLESVKSRGLFLSSVGSLIQVEQANLPRSRGNISVKIIIVEDNFNFTFSPLLVRPSINMGNIHNKEAVKVPTRLLANSSWNILGDLAQEVVSKDTQSFPPLTVTLVTYDAAFFCDSDIECHKAAANKFWTRIRPLFHKNQLCTIELVVFISNTVRVVGGEKSAVSTEEAKRNNAVDKDAKEECNKNSNEESEKTNVKDMVNILQQYFTNLAESDYKNDRSSDRIVNPISISVLAVEFDDGFGAIGRNWIQRILSPPNLKSNIMFELPETRDGTQCSISLDIRYRLLPYRADSSITRGLVADLHVLSSSNLEVVQLCPMSCVDANMLFGVAMEAIPGFHDDENQYREMKALVYVLFKHLRSKDLVLFLRATTSNEESMPSNSFGSPLHHTCHQTYILMAEHFQTNTQPFLSQESVGERLPLPVKATLYRYANAQQMISVNRGELYTPEIDADTLSHLDDYVESSFAILPNNDINPLLHDEEENYDSKIEQMSLSSIGPKHKAIMDHDKEEEKWNDKTGVGSTVMFDKSPEDEAVTGLLQLQIETNAKKTNEKTTLNLSTNALPNSLDGSKYQMLRKSDSSGDGFDVGSMKEKVSISMKPQGQKKDRILSSPSINGNNDEKCKLDEKVEMNTGMHSSSNDSLNDVSKIVAKAIRRKHQMKENKLCKKAAGKASLGSLNDISDPIESNDDEKIYITFKARIPKEKTKKGKQSNEKCELSNNSKKCSSNNRKATANPREKSNVTNNYLLESDDGNDWKGFYKAESIDGKMKGDKNNRNEHKKHKKEYCSESSNSDIIIPQKTKERRKLIDEINDILDDTDSENSDHEVSDSEISDLDDSGSDDSGSEL